MDTLQTAQEWRHLGIATIPCCARSKRPAIDSWKRYQTELPSSRQLEKWFASGRYNLAVVTGWRGLVVLDFDDMAVAFPKWIDNMNDECFDVMRPTYVVNTARGLHYYFYSQEPIENTRGEGWDIKAGGGYVLGTPSEHPSGHIYRASWSPSDIIEIKSIWDFVERPIVDMPTMRHHKADPFDIAMRDKSGTTIEVVNAAHTIESHLGISASSLRIMAYCPFHADTHESFAIYPDGHWHCYGCQEHGGDYVDFYARLKGLTIVEVLCELG